MHSVRIGFLGAGGFAHSHAFALDALKHYYEDAPAIERRVIASPTPASREAFANRFGFEEAIHPDALWEREDIDTVFILGPNHTHTPQLLQAARMPAIKRIYVEKPIGISRQDLHDLETFEKSKHGKFILVGFQFLQKSALRKALAHWNSRAFGEPIHFRAEYLHASYLDFDYRQKNAGRLLPIPANGAVADLGAHALSLLIAFLGGGLIVRTAATSGRFEDAPKYSDLCTTVMLQEPTSGAIGTLLASRVSQGTGDQLSLEIRATQGALRFDSAQPDIYQTYLPEYGWQSHAVMSDYLPSSTFPSGYTPSGWLRALVHNHYLFLDGDAGPSFVPDLKHGIQVQRLIQAIADQIIEA